MPRDMTKYIGINNVPQDVLAVLRDMAKRQRRSLSNLCAGILADAADAYIRPVQDGIAPIPGPAGAFISEQGANNG